MKNLLVILLILTGFCSGLNAQGCGDNCKKKEQIKAQKVAFITDKLQLTVEEAQQFWPVYNELDKKSEDIDNQIRTIVCQKCGVTYWITYGDAYKEKRIDKFLKTKLP